MFVKARQMLIKIDGGVLFFGVWLLGFDFSILFLFRYYDIAFSFPLLFCAACELASTVTCLNFGYGNMKFSVASWIFLSLI